MTKHLQLNGCYINKKKVYRIMKEKQLLKPKIKFSNKQYVRYRKVCPWDPYEVLEMDIEFKWIASRMTYAYILTILDIFSRRVLSWHAGMSITQHTVKDIWKEVIVNHLQEYDTLRKRIHIEVRNDNDKRFSAKSVQTFLRKIT